ncbi:MAG: DNA-protecting protein DprA [Gammaproteobacteria bacterium]|nr:DNA-protecting protein DprA [Gammaproteobacteria bacterium]
MDQLSDWLLLSHVPGIGPATFGTLVQTFGSAAAVLSASREELRSAGLSSARLEGVLNPLHEGVERDLRWAEQPGHTILTRHDQAYPQRLREITHPPAVLYVNGNPSHLADPQLAIVGSRNPTPIGQETARTFAAYIASTGLIVTSGLALGIDAIGHQGALDAGGISIAVAGTGLDRIYPARHRKLAHRIVEQGAIVSEFPIGTAPRAEHFPRRNRIISGLSLGTLIVEATRRSGSLITARYAMEQGREIFAIPGSIHNPMARGCNKLIKEGAKLVEVGADILEELSSIIDLKPAAIPPPDTLEKNEAQDLDIEYTRLLNCVGYEPTSIDILIERSGLTVEEVSSMLLILELKGHAKCSSGGLYTRLTMVDINERIRD